MGISNDKRFYLESRKIKWQIIVFML
jgi:hypothetical protein